MGKFLLLMLVLVGVCCSKSHTDTASTGTIKGGDKYVLTTGCCGHYTKDTVEVIGFIQECVLVKDNTGNQNLHNTKYFKQHIKPIQ